MKSAGSDVDRLHFDFGDLAALLISIGIEPGSHSQSCFGASRTDETDHDLMRFKRLSSPIAGDVAEHAVFDLVSFACSWREVADFNRLADLIGELLELQFPEAIPATVAAPTVRCDQ